VVYAFKKNFEVKKPRKSYDEMFFTQSQVKQLLDCVKADGGRFMRRDHAAIFLGFHLGLRIGEVRLLTRETFRDVDDGIVHVRRLKSLPRLPHRCPPCGRRVNVAVNRIGDLVICPRCGQSNPVKAPHKKLDRDPPEKVPPVVEHHVLEYARAYIASLPEGQKHLFVSQRGTPISVSMLSRVIANYVLRCGLSPKYSWHAFRHGRGVLIWERFEDPVMVRDSLGQKSMKAAEMYMRLSPTKREEYRDKLERDTLPMEY
jgi:integrase